ncbi:MAG: penicillin-binding protein 2 [Acidobacteria bacterium]|nr:penicillin-binding protein 2 [Acidobacteriota bacterium]
MELQQETNKQLILQRLGYFRYPVLLIFLILVARLWQLQIIQGSEYALKAENNRIRTIELAAPRGAILDRNRVPLVEHRSSFTVLLYRESMNDPDATTLFLTEKLAVNPEDLESELRRSRKTGLYRPIVVKGEAGMEDISIIEAHRRDHPEIQLVPKPRRLYHYGKLAAHLLGYIGEVTEQELERNAFPGAEIGALVGQSGVERIYNGLLVGRNGQRLVLVDSRGREVGLLDETPPVVGGSLRLTLDLKLQLAAEKALEGNVGAIVAMNPVNGEILAMASAPAYDPNDFSIRLSHENWNALLEDPHHPMQNRSIQNSYSPGSIFKLVIAKAGMEEGILDGDASVFCSGSADYYGRTFHCGDKTGHGKIRLEQAIAKSCNIFFYETGKQLGISKIAEHAASLGLGEKTGVDLPGERSGIIPSPEWKKEARGEPWYPGETIPVSIGQGAVSTTPLQILRAVCALVNGGRLVTPHVLMDAEYGGGTPEWPVAQVPLHENTGLRIREGMWQGVKGGGTGHAAAIAGMDICGKTGTAQIVNTETEKRFEGTAEDHAWFAGFSSKDDPEIAVVVFIEHGGKGGAVAAPLARAIFASYYKKGN